jgi:hypothetical protein
MSTALVSSKIKRKTSAASPQDDASRHIQTQILRELIIPAIEQEVNEGEQFAPLRQIYHSLILAAWYKNNLRQSILGKNYADQKIIGGLSVDDKGFKEAIYARYLEAFHKGVFNYIKEDVAEGDRLARETVPRQYFSGGFTAAGSSRYETAASPAGMRRGITGSP